MKIEAVSYIINKALTEDRTIIIKLNNGSIIVTTSHNCSVYWDCNAITLNNEEEIISCDHIQHVLKGETQC